MAAGAGSLPNLNRLAKWRAWFAGWQLGTRLDTDPECQAVQDHREVTLMLRAEMNALVALLVDRGVISGSEWVKQLEHEADLLEKSLQQRWPGVRATDEGLAMDARVVETTRGWRP